MSIASVILAGGLTPDNVADAVRIAMPYAVDVVRSVEDDAHRKVPERVRALARRVEAYYQSGENPGQPVL